MNKDLKPKVSIVIPVYNGANYLKDALDSALAQTYKNIEIIVINDGSNDNGQTDEICKSYGKKIRYFKKENGGAASALNMGIEKMEGDYFSWLSHDDVYYPYKIERQIKKLSKLNDKKIILYGNYDIIDQNSKYIEKGFFNHKELIRKPEYSLLRGVINGITLLIPKEAFDKYGKFDESLKCTQDYDMWKRMIKTFKFVHMPEILAKSRRHALQDSNKHPNVTLEGDPLWIDMMEDLSKKDKERLEGSEYNFYKEMKRFLTFNSPYMGAAEYANRRMETIFSNAKNEIEKVMVSVIIPVRGEQKALLTSIDSIKKQDHINWEILLVDDEKVKSFDKIQKYISEDSRIRIIKTKKNSHIGSMRNSGILSAKGEYIAFLDLANEFEKTKLTKQVGEMLLSNYDVSHTSYIRKYKTDTKIIDSGKLSNDVIPVIINDYKVDLSTVIVKKDFLEENNYKFKTDIWIGEDVCFVLEIVRNAKLLGIEEALTIIQGKEDDLDENIARLTNILAYIFSNEDYSKYHAYISNMCKSYVSLSEDITARKERKNISLVPLAFSNKFSKLIYLFKYQGVGLTIKKIIRKYVPGMINKIKRNRNGK